MDTAEIDSKRARYQVFRHQAEGLGRFRAVRKLTFILSWLDWREACAILGLVNGNPALQGAAMSRINRDAEQMAAAYHRLRSGGARNSASASSAASLTDTSTSIPASRNARATTV